MDSIKINSESEAETQSRFSSSPSSTADHASLNEEFGSPGHFKDTAPSSPTSTRASSLRFPSYPTSYKPSTLILPPAMSGHFSDDTCPPSPTSVATSNPWPTISESMTPSNPGNKGPYRDSSPARVLTRALTPNKCVQPAVVTEQNQHTNGNSMRPGLGRSAMLAKGQASTPQPQPWAPTPKVPQSSMSSLRVPQSPMSSTRVTQSPMSTTTIPNVLNTSDTV